MRLGRWEGTAVHDDYGGWLARLSRDPVPATTFIDGRGAHSEGKLRLERIASACEQAVCSLQQS